MKNNNLIFKVLFSSVFILLAVLIVMFDWFRDRIDNRVIALALISFIPWIIKYLKSLEAFGVKAELVSEEQKTKVEINMEKMNETKSINQPNIESNIDFDKDVITFNNYKYTKDNKEAILLMESLVEIEDTDDILTKLVLSRVQIEKIIKLMCKENDIQFSTIKRSSEILYEKNIIKEYEYNLINLLLPILNKAIHSDLDSTNFNDIYWVVEKCLLLLEHLEILFKKPDLYCCLKHE